MTIYCLITIISLLNHHDSWSKSQGLHPHTPPSPLAACEPRPVEAAAGRPHAGRCGAGLARRWCGAEPEAVLSGEDMFMFFCCCFCVTMFFFLVDDDDDDFSSWILWMIYSWRVDPKHSILISSQLGVIIIQPIRTIHEKTRSREKLDQNYPNFRKPMNNDDSWSSPPIFTLHCCFCSITLGKTRPNFRKPTVSTCGNHRFSEPSNGKVICRHSCSWNAGGSADPALIQVWDTTHIDGWSDLAPVDELGLSVVRNTTSACQ